jgi:hypothetical protein
MSYPTGPVNDITGNNNFTFPARLINSDTFNSQLTWAAANPLVVTDFESIGAPAFQNEVVYQTGFAHMQFGSGTSAWNAAVIMAYQANPSMTFITQNPDGTPTQLPGAAAALPGNNMAQPSPTLQLSQPNLLSATPNQYITLSQNVNFTVDSVTGAITIFDCRSHGTNATFNGNTANGESFNVCEPFSVQQVGGSNGGQPAILGATLQLNAAGNSVLDNLLWWMIIPMQLGQGPSSLPAFANVLGIPNIPSLIDVQPAGGPSVIGNTLYYGTVYGDIICIDLTNMPQNGSQATLFKSDGTLRAQMTPALTSQYNVTYPPAMATTVNQPVVSPPVGTTDVVVSSTPNGITALDNGLTLITDEDRLLQVDHLVNAVLSIDSTQTQSVVGGSLAGNGQIASTKISFARPSKAIHDTVGTFVVADSGNNRVIETNSGGVITWEIHSFNNGLQYLRPGDPLTLNHPTDVQMYTLAGNGLISFTSPLTNNTYSYNGSYYSVHYLVADSGNSRAIEIVDIYDGNGNPVVMTSSGGPNVIMQRQIVFVTNTLSEQNKSLRYRTVQQFVDPTNTLYQASIVDNVATGGSDLTNTAPVVGTQVDAPGGSVLIVTRTGGANDGALVSRITGIYDPNLNQHFKLSGPTFFKEYTAPGNTNTPVHYLLCDANGCYDLVPVTQKNPVPAAFNGEAVVTWALYSADYEVMTGRPLRAASIERLGKADYNAVTNLFYPHYLITNRYTGDDNVVAHFGLGLAGGPLANVSNGQIRGEVVEVRSDIYYYGLNGGSQPYLSGYRTPAAALYQVSQVTGFNILSPQNASMSAIVWMAPKETIFPSVPPLGTAAPPIKRSIGSLTTTGTSSYILEQPSFADRPY